MAGSYNGGGVTTEKEKTGKKRFDWISFIIWIFSLLVALIPIYLLLLKNLTKNGGKIDVNFFYESFVVEDTLWVLATVLLFSGVNCIVRYIQNYRKNKELTIRVWEIVLLGIAGLVFIVSESTWVFFKNKMTVETPVAWAMWISIVFCIISLIVSTPLQMNFLKEDK